MNAKSKILTWISLPLIAAYPVVIGAMQILDYIQYNNSDTSALSHGLYSPSLLAFCFIISWWQRFCIYHRIVIAVVLVMQIDITLLPLLLNLLNLILILILSMALTMCLIHFSIQIKSFIRYVKSEKQGFN